METLKRRGPYRRYDSRLKDLVAQGGGLGLIRELRIPRSTLWTWRRRTSRAVVSHEVLGLEEESLRDQAALLARKCEELAAKLDLQESLRDAMGWRLAQGRFPGAEIKERLLNLAEKAAGKLSLKDCLQAIGLSLSRYKSWRMRWRKCELADQSSCPKLSPTKLTSVEISGMGELVCDKRYSHFPIRALAYHAARLGRLMASPGTWARYIGKHAWRRPRVRVYPARPRIGLRAARPNEYWHIDTTIFRLLDGTKAALQACIDNFSRYVLAWRLSRSPTGLGCRELLLQALRKAITLNPLQGPARVICDSGVENVNRLVDELLAQGRVIREIAQLEIDYSNSLIERFFQSIKHNYLFQRDLTSMDVLAGHAGFYIREHNEIMPHSAFRGATPEEVYVGGWVGLVGDSVGKEAGAAKARRIAYHGGMSALSCGHDVMYRRTMRVSGPVAIRLTSFQGDLTGAPAKGWPRGIPGKFSGGPRKAQSMATGWPPYSPKGDRWNSKG